MIKKKGTPEKILNVVGTEAEFTKLKSKIAADNNLKRCKSCNQLLAKFDSENKIINVQRKNLDLIADVSNTKVRCPHCQQVNIL